MLGNCKKYINNIDYPICGGYFYTDNGITVFKSEYGIILEFDCCYNLLYFKSEHVSNYKDNYTSCDVDQFIKLCATFARLGIHNLEFEYDYRKYADKVSNRLAFDIASALDTSVYNSEVKFILDIIDNYIMFIGSVVSSCAIMYSSCSLLYSNYELFTVYTLDYEHKTEFEYTDDLDCILSCINSVNNDPIHDSFGMIEFHDDKSRYFSYNCKLDLSSIDVYNIASVVIYCDIETAIVYNRCYSSGANLLTR